MKQSDGAVPRLLTAGYVTLDVIIRDLKNRDYWHAAGGTSGNVSVFASALGAKVTVLGRIGEDKRGQRLLNDLTAAGVNTSRIERDASLNTPGIFELVRYTRRGTHRFTYICPICETRLPKDAVISRKQAAGEIESLDQFDAFFYDRATPGTLFLAKAAHEAGLLVMFEPPSIPRTELALRAAAFSDIVKVSLSASHRARQWHLGLGQNDTTKFIIETLGAKGARIRSRARHEWSELQELPAFASECIRDTAGAGDWLSAGLLTNLIAQTDFMNIDKMRLSVEYGQRLSAISLAYDGPNGALLALGPRAIEQFAREPASVQVPPTDGSYNSVPEFCMTQLASHCELCLTEKGDAVSEGV